MGWFSKTHQNYPDFYKVYLEHFKSKTEDLKDQRFIVFDTETTGLNPKSDRILSIGTVGIKDFEINVNDAFECYVQQEAFNSETVEIHGILKSGTIEKIKEEEAIVKFLDHIKNAILIAHHAAFDIAMINEALFRLGLPKLKNKVVDTGDLYKKTKFIKDNSHYSLDELCKLFKLPMHDRHTASGDAFLTALVFLKTSALLRKKKKHLKLKHFVNWF